MRHAALHRPAVFRPGQDDDQPEAGRSEGLNADGRGGVRTCDLSRVKVRSLKGTIVVTASVPGGRGETLTIPISLKR